MTCKNCGLKSCRCYDSSDLDSEGEDIFYVSDLSGDEDYSSSDDSSDYNSSDDSSDEDYVYNSSDDDDSD